MGFLLKFVKWGLILALAGMFIASGANKLTDRIDAGTHQYLVGGFQTFVKDVIPFNQLGWSAETLRVVVGLIEVGFGALMLCPYYTRLSAFVFMCVMGGAVSTHMQLSQPIAMPAALGAASALLFLVSGSNVPSKPAASSNKKKQ